MNLGKLSGLKSLVSGSGGKRKFKGELTPDMISPPLGDFRHTMHVGRGGDVFGDTSFLSNHGGQGANNGDGCSTNGDANDTASSTPGKSEGFFTRTLRHVRVKTAAANESRSQTPDSKEPSPPPPAVSPIIKNAISLPRLDVVDSANGSAVKTLFPSTPPKPAEDSSYTYGLESGFVTLPRLSRSERQQQPLPQQPTASTPSHYSSTCSPDTSRGSMSAMPPVPVPILSFSASGRGSVRGSVRRRDDSSYSGYGFDHDTLSLTGSLTSFTLDLGPSLMSEVFGLIDKPGSQLGLGDSTIVPPDDDDDGRRGGGDIDHDIEANVMSYTLPVSVTPPVSHHLPHHNHHHQSQSQSEVDSATVSLVDSLLREDYSGSKALYGGLDWGEEEGEEEEGEEEEEEESLRAGSSSPMERGALLGAGSSSGRGSITSSSGSSSRQQQHQNQQHQHQHQPSMDTEHFQRATDVLARHYGSGGSSNSSSGGGSSRSGTVFGSGTGTGFGSSSVFYGSTVTDSTRSSQRSVPYHYVDDEEEIKV
ncbi:uncharacterized protein cdc42ep1a [Engraulis encrasicolus]|uniref:uncharacterized protein cdc42ep1a n=1 Tax=Engraulis encrasicolus TaxID=184585 RepID=UPI002FD29AE4